ncbi:hypothetical protein M422DRAFT_45173 [Sphaerobolus stellatus SS14]|nr:hypothetical protein M422DRAFT_45173 [Sphaerobolus stellatus SS14]
MKAFVLYDFASRTGRGWNPFPLRARYSLEFKGLPYQTVWIQYPEIETIMKEIGAPSTKKKPDGSPGYTLPVIVDPNYLGEDGKPVIIADSLAIAAYLDRQYPSKKALIPKGTSVLIAILDDYINKTIFRAGVPIFIPLAYQILEDQSREYYLRTRTKSYPFARSISENQEGSDDWTTSWTTLEKIFSEIGNCFDDNTSTTDRTKEDFITGTSPTFADFSLASVLESLAVLAPKQWEELMSQWDDGRWGRYRERCAAWLNPTI